MAPEVITEGGWLHKGTGGTVGKQELVRLPAADDTDIVSDYPQWAAHRSHRAALLHTGYWKGLMMRWPEAGSYSSCSPAPAHRERRAGAGPWQQKRAGKVWPVSSLATDQSQLGSVSPPIRAHLTAAPYTLGQATPALVTVFTQPVAATTTRNLASCACNT